MENVIYLLFVCIAAPLTLMLALLETKSKRTVGFMIIGMFLCVFVAEINGLLYNMLGMDVYYITTTVTPIVEEVVKAVPVLLYAFLFSDDRHELMSLAIAVGIGFAVLESSYILVGNVGTFSIFTAIVRGFGTGLMHGICTATVGAGMSYVHKKKKLFYTGTFALLITAIIYHAIYNALVQSAYSYVGYLLPIVTYIPIVYFGKKISEEKKNNKM
ncbi:MAG: PrsW family intramembrane metalloprotease [Firmicutes bacterium]|nr:PrsW family intramembrane metalloprotease [Bacillota bacterium]